MTVLKTSQPLAGVDSTTPGVISGIVGTGPSVVVFAETSVSGPAVAATRTGARVLVVIVSSGSPMSFIVDCVVLLPRADEEDAVIIGGIWRVVVCLISSSLELVFDGHGSVTVGGRLMVAVFDSMVVLALAAEFFTIDDGQLSSGLLFWSISLVRPVERLPS